MKELRIYGVQFGSSDEDIDNFADNAEIENFTDEQFISRAEDEGNVFTLRNLLRTLESCNYGAESYDENFYNMTLRAYLIEVANTDDVAPVRVDLEDVGLDINEIKQIAEVI